MKKALVIDDQNYTAVFVKRALTKEFGFEVKTAENGKDGLVKYSSFKPDIIFLDVSMPEMNGLDFIKVLRNSINDSTTYVVIMTAISDKNLVGKFIEYKILDYILKPLDYSGLVARLKKIFEKLPDFFPADEAKKEEEINPESQDSENKDKE